ncbi:MAG TPA: TetR/AcrR family transcriptional regulator [Candidatus Dormibacteraeota bacterium]
MAEAVKRSDQESGGRARPRRDAAALRLSARWDRGAPAIQPVVDVETLLPPRAAVDGTSRRILISALVRFAEWGYHAAPVREIARGAGVRASSMYEYRASKEQLLLDLMLIAHEEHAAWLREALDRAGDDPVRRMRELVSAHVRLHATYPLLARVGNRELGSLGPEALEEVVAVRRASEDMIEDTVRAGVEAGVFQVPDAWLAVAAIGAMGIRVAEWFGPASGFTADEVAGAYSEFALRLLGYRTA